MQESHQISCSRGFLFKNSRDVFVTNYFGVCVGEGLYLARYIGLHYARSTEVQAQYPSISHKQDKKINETSMIHRK